MLQSHCQLNFPLGEFQRIAKQKTPTAVTHTNTLSVGYKKTFEVGPRLLKMSSLSHVSRRMASSLASRIKTGPISGRFANTSLNVTVFGAYGFVGRYLIEELGKIHCGVKLE
jgi:aspartate-semialdehyde dehydrogenase